MRLFTRIALIVIVAGAAGCAQEKGMARLSKSGPAKDARVTVEPAPDFMVRVVEQLNNVRKPPVKLTDLESLQVMAMVNDKCSEMFGEEELDTPVFASWARFAQVTQPDKLTFTRFSADGQRFGYVVFELSGSQFTFGAADSNDTSPPWSESLDVID